MTQVGVSGLKDETFLKNKAYMACVYNRAPLLTNEITVLLVSAGNAGYFNI